MEVKKAAEINKSRRKLFIEVKKATEINKSRVRLFMKCEKDLRKQNTPVSCSQSFGK